jgi:hypothetical protein
MSIYHCSIKIINRAGGRSAVASAAYRSGEKLHNDETGLTYDFTKKGGVIMNEIILPENAPEEFRNREFLWNEVQKIEKRNDAQFAREIEVALPVEMKREEQIECVRNYINENFVSKGMIADWALHDKGDGNPHAHIMLTVREVDSNKKWMAKQKSVFANARDEKGRAIYNPDFPSYNPKDKEATEKYRIPKLDENGNQKVRIREGKGTELLWEKVTIPANDWNDRKNAEVWRESWAKHCNRYLDKDNQIDHRSYERQGLDIMPSIHEGVTARKMEADGKIADRCQINRDIKELNFIRKQLKQLAKEITELITEKARAIYDRFKELRRSFGDSRSPETDGGNTGKSADGNRRTGDGKPESERRTGRIAEIRRGVDESIKETELTDREIEETDSRISKLKQLIKEKEVKRDDRLKKLKQRRRASDNIGGTTGSDRDTYEGSKCGEIQKLREQQDDIRTFISKLRDEERASEEKRDNKILERNNREAERERQSTENKRTVSERESDVKDERKGRKERSR